MAKANPISPEDWKIVSLPQNNQTLFNYTSRLFLSKTSLPAQKLHVVEFFFKP